VQATCCTREAMSRYGGKLDVSVFFFFFFLFLCVVFVVVGVFFCVGWWCCLTKADSGGPPPSLLGRHPWGLVAENPGGRVADPCGTRPTGGPGAPRTRSARRDRRRGLSRWRRSRPFFRTSVDRRARGGSGGWAPPGPAPHRVWWGPPRNGRFRPGFGEESHPPLPPTSWIPRGLPRFGAAGFGFFSGIRPRMGESRPPVNSADGDGGVPLGCRPAPFPLAGAAPAHKRGRAPQMGFPVSSAHQPVQLPENWVAVPAVGRPSPVISCPIPRPPVAPWALPKARRMSPLPTKGPVFPSAFLCRVFRPKSVPPLPRQRPRGAEMSHRVRIAKLRPVNYSPPFKATKRTRHGDLWAPRPASGRSPPFQLIFVFSRWSSPPRDECY